MTNILRGSSKSQWSFRTMRKRKLGSRRRWHNIVCNHIFNLCLGGLLLFVVDSIQATVTT